VHARDTAVDHDALAKNVFISQQRQKRLVVDNRITQIPLLISEQPFQPPESAKRIADEAALKLYADVSRASVSIETDKGVGSGFFVDPEGHVLSAAHVVANTKEITVTTSDGKRYGAKIEALADTMDLVKLKLEDFDATKNLKYVQLRNSSKLERGEKVYAIGHPHGSDLAYLSPGEFGGKLKVYDLVNKDKLAINFKTMTQAEKVELVQALSTDVVATNAHVEPGNSGGLLVDAKGELVGVAQTGHISASYYRTVEDVRNFLAASDNKFQFVYCDNDPRKVSAIKSKPQLSTRIDSIDRSDDGRFSTINYDSVFGLIGRFFQSGVAQSMLTPPRLCEIRRTDGDARPPFEWHSIPFRGQ
jgi:hypothetical protein